MEYCIRLRIRWKDSGIVGPSEHMNGRLVVQYLKYLHRVGDDIEVLSIEQGYPLIAFAREASCETPPVGVRIVNP